MLVRSRPLVKPAQDVVLMNDHGGVLRLYTRYLYGCKLCSWALGLGCAALNFCMQRQQLLLRITWGDAALCCALVCCLTW